MWFAEEDANVNAPSTPRRPALISCGATAHRRREGLPDNERHGHHPEAVAPAPGGRSRSKAPSAVRLQTPPAGDTRWAERLQAEVAELKLATASAPSKSSPPSGTADIPIELPSEAPADGRPGKKRALFKPLRDEGLDELKSEFSDFKNGMKEFQAELRNMLMSLSEAFSALSMRVAALESTVGSGSSGSTVTDLSSSSGSSKARAPQKAGKQPPVRNLLQGKSN
ncbi:hypothetical protein MTO96_043071 [Rhipicephalus appendiculatus]